MRHVQSATSFRLVPITALVLALAGTGICADIPAKMTHAIIQMNGDDIPSDSFGAKPKTFWRASNQYCRVDEEPDPDKGIHGRMIINEPDAWLINLEDNTAKHLLDRGPTFNCRLPIFAMDKSMAKSKIGELEVGRELEFFNANGAKQIQGPKLQFEANYYELDVEDASLRLVERADIHAPIMVALMRGAKTYTARYLLWEEIPFKANLFERPTGTKIEEVN